MNAFDVRYGFCIVCIDFYILRSFAARHTQKMMYLTSCLTHVYSLVGSSSVHKNPSLYEKKKKRGALSHIALEEARNFCIVCVHLRFFHPRRRRRFRRRYYYQHTTTPNNNNNIKNIERGERKRVDKETFPPFFDLVLLPTQINKFAYSSSSYFH